MPVLVSERDPGRIFEWSCNTFVGRRMIGGLSFDEVEGDDRAVSSVHAAIVWNRKSGCWFVHDLGSANGTWVNGEQVAVDKPQRVGAGSRIVFGRSTWTMRESEPPPAAATSDRGRLRLAVENLLLLPDERDPAWVISLGEVDWFIRPWVGGVDDGDAGRVVVHGEQVEAGGRVWTVALPSDADLKTDQRTNVTAGRIAEHLLELWVPANMEDIEAMLVRDGHRVSLPSRRHHELWWLLATARAEQRAERGDDAGWVACDEMVRRLGLDETGYLNVLVYRSRAQLKKAGFADYGRIIERRLSGQPELRIGISNVRVVQR